ncbi:MAG: glycosyltransferase family 2 protein [Lysobacter sp.]
MTVVLWSCLAVLAFTYFGYPMVLVVMAAGRKPPACTAASTVPVDVLLVVHDGAAQLTRKLDNLVALDYPFEQLRINVVCDGCTDATEEIARNHPSPRIRVFAFPERAGKSACIGRVLPRLDAEVVMFTDVRQSLASNALSALVAALVEPGVGAASGELVIVHPEGFARGVDAYWRYEKQIRRLESATGSMVGATGALYAARRSAIHEVPAGLILDDMWIPLQIAAQGYRVVFVPDAVAYDHGSPDVATEETRKRRTLAGNYQLIHRWPALALPWGHPLAWRLWGHKWLRLIAPWMLLFALASCTVLAFRGDAFYQWLLALQLAAYATALVGRAFPPVARALMPARMAAAFLSLNTSAVLALSDYLRHPNAHLWQTTHYPDPSQ